MSWTEKEMDEGEEKEEYRREGQEADGRRGK